MPPDEVSEGIWGPEPTRVLQLWNSPPRASLFDPNPESVSLTGFLTRVGVIHCVRFMLLLLCPGSPS